MNDPSLVAGLNSLQPSSFYWELLSRQQQRRRSARQPQTATATATTTTTTAPRAIARSMYRGQRNPGVDDHHDPLISTSASTTAAFTTSPYPSPIYGVDPAITPHAFSNTLQPHSARQAPHPSTEAGSMQPPSSTSPRMTSNSPGPNYAFRPNDRVLPPKDVTADTIADAYVAFILYTNPNFPLDVDTSTLKTTFETGLPKSDNKDFATFRLFELIKKFDSKEIKTWGQLALDLGVEAPDPAKGQSAQKVQQYSVRLKRWMRAMHIDAFFEYLMGKQHVYFTEIPPPNDPYPSAGRDGVTAEEDLAIRALDPSFRPKRGRRRNSETDPDDKAEGDAKGQSTLDSAAPYSAAPMSALPMSAHPDSGFHDPWAVASAVTPQSFAPWSARTQPSAVSNTSSLRWQLGQNQTPGTPHPTSGSLQTPMSAPPDSAYDEPKSAVTPSRKRRRHGPAVSSAWSSNSGPGAKPRGRPPANRNVQDGPFTTFPADPNSSKSKYQSELPTPSTAIPTPSTANDSSRVEPSPVSAVSVASMSSQPGEGRGGKLSLQVPPHRGGPVRLATPPALLVNGDPRESETRSDSDDPSRATLMQPPPSHPTAPLPESTSRPPNFSFEALRRVVASDLLRADIHGRRQRLTGDEAKRLADSVLDRLSVPRTDAGDPREDMARLMAASWLGVGDQFNVPLGPSAGHGKRINVTRFRTDADGYEEITYDGTADDCREVFDIYWHVSQGGCMGSFEMKGLSFAPASVALNPESTHDRLIRKSIEALSNADKDGWAESAVRDVYTSSVREARRSGDENIDWRAKYKALEFAAMVAKGTVERERQSVLEKILAVLI